MVYVLLDRSLLADFCRRWGVSELAVFGSAVRQDFRPDSDLDVLVSPSAGVVWTLLELSDMRDGLASLAGRPVDLVVRRAVERSPNWIRRREILDSAEILYAA
jgi:predicted nucleotidyltransferase